MEQQQYLAHVRSALEAQDFTIATTAPDLAARLPLILTRHERWGHLTVALAALDRVDPADRDAAAQAAGAWVRAEGARDPEGQRRALILVFPFTRKVPEETAAAIAGLRAEREGGRWAVIPWTADLEVELLDQHTGFPRVDPAVARALTEVPRGRVEQTWRQVTGPQIGRRGSGRLRIDLGYLPTTRLILAVTIAVHVLVLSMGGNGLLGLLAGSPDYLAWGANNGSLVLLRHQQWRLLTYMLLHGGLLHLGLNMWALWNVGRHAEMIYGPLRMLFIYVVAGVSGGIASAVLRPAFTTSVGASGAIMGLMGALLYFAVAMPGRQVDWRAVLRPVIINIGYGLFLGGLIDNYAHIGGFIGGLAAAFLAGIPGERKPWRVVAMAVGAVVVAAVVGGLIPLSHRPLFGP